MCGIGGIVRVHTGDVPPAPVSIPDAWLDVLDGAIAHRGPDGHGRFRDRAIRADGRTVDVALVHRRLAIIDPAGGVQPLVTGEGNGLCATVFNGCIYNHRELRKELEKNGHRFTTDHSDTEVIPRAHAEWEDQAPARFDGMFAYALWSRQKAEVLIARDFAGEKTLYETTLHHPAHGDLYVFASSAAAIGKWLTRFGSQFGYRGLRCSKGGLLDWLRFGGSLVPLMEDIDEADVRLTSRFTNAWNEGDDQQSHAARDWYAELPPRKHGTPAMTPESVDDLLGRAVRSRLESDVPLGCFLSGGVDSSLVAWHAKHALGSLRTFTVTMPDTRYDESAFAQRVAEVIGSTHTTLPCDPRPAEQLPMLIEQLGLPFGDSSLLPTYWVSAAARQHIKVALTGDAGDELFMGYERYVAARFLTFSHGLLRYIPTWVGAGAHSKSMRSKLERVGIAARGGYDELRAIFPRPMVQALAPALKPTLSHLHVGFHKDAPRADFEWYLPGDLLRKTDTAAMSVALETRAPFLAREVVHFGLSTPLDLLGRGGLKGLLRATARLHLPKEIVDRPKMGFAIPIGDWFRTDFGGMRALLRDAVTSNDAFPSELLGIELSRPYIERLMGEHERNVRDHGQRLYMLLVLALWCQMVRNWGRP